MGRGRRTRLRAQGYTKKHELRRRRHPRTKTVSRHTKTANPAQSTDEEQTRNSRVACRKNQDTQLLTSSSVPARLDHPCQCQAHGAWCPARATDLMRALLERPNARRRRRHWISKTQDAYLPTRNAKDKLRLPPIQGRSTTKRRASLDAAATGSRKSTARTPRTNTYK